MHQCFWMNWQSDSLKDSHLFCSWKHQCFSTYSLSEQTQWLTWRQSLFSFTDESVFLSELIEWIAPDLTQRLHSWIQQFLNESIDWIDSVTHLQTGTCFVPEYIRVFESINWLNWLSDSQTVTCTVPKCMWFLNESIEWIDSVTHLQSLVLFLNASRFLNESIDWIDSMTQIPTTSAKNYYIFFYTIFWDKPQLNGIKYKNHLLAYVFKQIVVYRR